MASYSGGSLYLYQMKQFFVSPEKLTFCTYTVFALLYWGTVSSKLCLLPGFIFYQVFTTPKYQRPMGHTRSPE